MIKYIKNEESIREFISNSIKDSEDLIVAITCPERFKNDLNGFKLMSDANFEIKINFHTEIDKFIFHEGVAWQRSNNV